MGRLRQLLGVFGSVGIVVVTLTGPVGTVASGGPSQVDGNVSVTQSPGAQFAGGIATEGATLENEHQRRSLNVSLERAQTSEARIGVINRAESTLDKRLDSLEARTARLAHARRTGKIEQDHYRATTIVLATEIDGIDRRIAILRNAVLERPTAHRAVSGSVRDELDQLAKRAHAVDENNDAGDVEDDDSTDDDDDFDDDDRSDDDDDDTSTDDDEQ